MASIKKRATGAETGRARPMKGEGQSLPVRRGRAALVPLRSEVLERGFWLRLRLKW